METKRRLRGFARRIFFCVVIMASGVALGNQSASQSGQPIKYELKIEGENIERLILQSDGEKQTFKNPGKSIMLESGTYEIYQLQLESGLLHYPYGNSKRLGAIEIEPDKTAVLKAGGPLEQQITVARKGQMLTMEYRLTGVAGEWYQNDARYPPTFTIYKGDKKITSGKFQFG